MSAKQKLQRKQIQGANVVLGHEHKVHNITDGRSDVRRRERQGVVSTNQDGVGHAGGSLILGKDTREEGSGNNGDGGKGTHID